MLGNPKGAEGRGSRDRLRCRPMPEPAPAALNRLLLGLRLLVAAAAGRHSGDSPLGCRGRLLVGARGRVNVLGGRKHDLRRGRMPGLGAGRRRGLGGLCCEGGCARKSCSGNQDEAGKHDRHPFQLAPELGPSSFRLPFDNWLRLLEYLSKRDVWGMLYCRIFSSRHRTLA